MAIWHEDDEFWRTAISGELRERWDAAPGEVEKAMALLDIEPPAAVLDLCCGIGRHSLDLARRGFAVTGVDRTRDLLEEARRLADADGLAVELVEQDMRAFRRPGAFDAAISMLTSFGTSPGSSLRATGVRGETRPGCSSGR
jgi:2-polyprenyl-3-methyl-5-hydroxy-6-metoxy-1,4-benzoquinol methylase